MDRKIQDYRLLGVNLDIPPDILGDEFWSNAQNVRFQRNATVRCDGFSYFAEPPQDNPLYLLPVQLPAVNYWIYPTPSGIFVTDGITHWNITPVGGIESATLPGDWTGGILNGLPFLNNGVDPPWWWDGQTGNPMQPLPGWPANYTCRALRAFKYHLIAMNINTGAESYPDMVMWSDAAAPGQVPATWVPAPDNEAGDILLSATAGGCVDGAKLRDSFVVYKNWSTYVLDYVGGAFIFGSRALFASSGIQSTNCVAELGGNHIVFTGDDVIAHDGSTYRSLVDNVVRHTIVNSIDPQLQDWCLVAARQSTDECWICIPEVDQSQLTQAYIINVRNGRIGLRTLPSLAYIARGIVQIPPQTTSWDQAVGSWNEYSGQWSSAAYSETADRLLAADTNGPHLLAIDAQSDNAGEAVSAGVERIGLELGGWRMRKRFTAIWPRVTGTEGDVIRIRIGAQYWTEEPVRWSQPVDYVIGSSERVSFDNQTPVDGRFFAISIGSEGGDAWAFHQFSVEYHEQGYE